MAVMRASVSSRRRLVRIRIWVRRCASRSETRRLTVASGTPRAREAAESGNTEETELHDRRFHLAIAEAGRNSAIASAIDRLWLLRSKSEISRSFHERARMQGSRPNIADHERILEALVRRDPDSARDAMRMHIGRVYDEFSRFSLT